MTFGLITEGPTDQVVLNTLLARYFSPDIDIRAVQPNTDSTDKADHFGGWVKVLNYCSSPDMAATLEVNNYVIIQIDTDVSDDYGVSKREGDRERSNEEIVEKTTEVIIARIDKALYELHKDKIIFAVSHGSIECWLLPLYCTDNIRTKTVNCCVTLNQTLRKEGFTIDCNNKRPFEYKKICKQIKTKAIVESISVHNNSFAQFIQQLIPIKF